MGKVIALNLCSGGEHTQNVDDRAILHLCWLPAISMRFLDGSDFKTLRDVGLLELYSVVCDGGYVS